MRAARLALLCFPLACQSAGPETAGPESAAPEPPTSSTPVAHPALEPPSDADRARYARRMLSDARAFSQQGRVDAAERALRRGLAAREDDALLHAELARLLRGQGRVQEAEVHQRRANELSPPPPPPPDEPKVASARGVLVALVPPDARGADPDRIPSEWPNGDAAAALRKRLEVRLPGARVVHADPGDVAKARRLLARTGARAALSLRVDRSFCDESRKDGFFAVAWLRFAAETQGVESTGSEVHREVVSNPHPPEACRRLALERALEGILASPAVERALAARAGNGSGWSRTAVRALFPEIGRHVEVELTRGRRRLAGGEITAALESFRGAAAIDPDDPHVNGYVREAELTLSMARELGREEAAPVSTLDPRLSKAQRAAAEVMLADERRRRDELLAAIAVLDEDVEPPTAETLAALSVSAVHDEGAFGARVARDRAQGDVETRAAFAPDGSLIARYYFPAGDAAPLVREEDTTGDGRPDRWIGYEAGARREIWEDGTGRGSPDTHFVFARGGSPVERIEIDASGDGRPDHVFDYARGVLVKEARDTNGDGALDRFDQLDTDGRVDVREEDLDGDGRIDVRSVFRAGKLVRREISDPAFAPDGT